MLRLGMIDFDTSHVVEFTRRFHHQGIGKAYWVDGAKVIAGVPGRSWLAPERIAGFTEEMRELGVELFEDPLDLLDKVDGVLVTSIDGAVHLERAKPFLERGVPTFVDKPFACSTADALALIALAEQHQTPLFTASSLRYAPEVASAAGGTSETGRLLGASVYGPALIHSSGQNPGLFHYGIHPVEMLFTLLGAGCSQVSCQRREEAEVVAAIWNDGKVATLCGLRNDRRDYGFTLFGTKGNEVRALPDRYFYTELLVEIVRFFQGKQAPIDPRESLEIVAFIEAANCSAEQAGAVIAIKV